MKGGARCNNTSCVNTSEKQYIMCQYIRKELTMMKGGARCNNTSCVNTPEKNWLWWRVVRDVTIHHVSIHQKRIDYDEGWCAMKGSGEEGKWWRWEVMRKGSGGDGKWWGREVRSDGIADDEEVMRKGSGDDGKWWGREVVTMGSGEEEKWWGMADRIGVFCKNGCSCVRNSMRFLKLWLQIALEWLHECCMGNVVGRKPEHETLCFSV